MASYELQAFQRFHEISLVGALEYQAPYTLNLGFWLRDPLQLIKDRKSVV